MTDMSTFEPGKYLTSIGGADYLEVKWRLYWLRTEHPDAVIETELYADNGERAIFKASVRIPQGGSATGWGDETIADFRDYLCKAESKALGRALAALGFGTQFAIDLDEAPARPADSPVRRPSRDGNDPATDRQIKAIYAIGRAGKLSDGEITVRVREQFGCTPEQLQRRDASAFIDSLKQEMGAGTGQARA